MALYRLALVSALCLLVLAGCDSGKTEGQSQARPVVEVTPATKATADVDRRATLALKQALMTSFPEATSTEAVEAGLIKDGFSCGPNPTAPDERACLQSKREGACEINKIIRSQPYLPDKAQVIKICEVGTQTRNAQ
jgi:hypothetical protein